jgi:hypothetical protein
MDIEDGNSNVNATPEGTPAEDYLNIRNKVYNEDIEEDMEDETAK